MRIRIVSGQFGGRFINAPNTRTTHPMSERARSAIFNIIGEEIIGSRVLDAFAGSGAIGLEALSRGANEVIFLENNRVASKVINENIQVLGVGEYTDVINTTVNNWLNTSDKTDFDYIFIDPPYHQPQFSTVKRLMGLVKVGGYVILSHPGRGGTPDKTGIVVVDNRSYGDACITFYHRES